MDDEQHRDSEERNSRIKRGSHQGARGKIEHQARGFDCAAIQPRVEELENRNSQRRNEIPSKVIADWNAEMRTRGIVPENLPQEPLLAEYAQWIDDEIDHHH